MPTVSVNLDVTQYVQVNTAFNPMVLQSHRDEVRITLSEAKPSVSNPVFHLLGGGDAPLHLHSIDTNVWALALTAASSLIVSETEPYPIAVHDGFGNPIGSLGGALNSHDADVHHNVFNQFLHYDTGVATNPFTAVNSGDNQIPFVSTVGFGVGDEIEIEGEELEPVFFTIKAIAGNVVDIDSPVVFSHSISTSITKVHTNFAAAGLTTSASRSSPIIFNSHIPSGSVVHVTNMVISMLDDNQMDDGSFAGVAALNNGVVIRAQSQSAVGMSTNWKDNRNIREDIFTAQYVDKQASDEYGFAASYNIKQSTGGIVILDGSLGDTFQALIQDDLVEITSLRIKLQGHYEG